MDVLVQWRNATLKKRTDDGNIRPLSPPAKLEGLGSHELAEKPSGDNKDVKDAVNKPILTAETKSEPEKTPEPPAKSWVQWWRSSRKRSNRDAESISVCLHLLHSLVHALMQSFVSH